MGGVIFSLSFLLTYKSVWQRRREPEQTVEVTGVELQQNKKRRLLIQPEFTHYGRGHLGLVSSKSFKMLRQRKAGWPLLGMVCVWGGGE